MSSEINDEGRSAANVYSFPDAAEVPHATFIRADLQALRLSVTAAWQERGVMLTSEEQSELRAEIADLCQYLKDLTGHRE